MTKLRASSELIYYAYEKIMQLGEIHSDGTATSLLVLIIQDR